MNRQTAKALDIASDLVTEEGPNPEYRRGIVEFVCQLIGLPDSYDVIEALIIGENGRDDGVEPTPVPENEVSLTNVDRFPCYRIACPYCEAPAFVACYDQRHGREGKTILTPHPQRIREWERRAPAGERR